MYVVILVFIIVVSLLMMLIVLVQNSKGGGLASNFSSSNQILGVRKTTDFLEKSTWTLAIILVLLCLASSLTIPQGGVNSGTQIDTEMRQQIDQNTVVPAATTITQTPTALPATEE